MTLTVHENQPGDLLIWWVPKLPMKPYRRHVSCLLEAKRLLEVLAEYDDFQMDNHVRADASNAGGLEVFDAGAWRDWEDPTTGESIDAISEARAIGLDTARGNTEICN